VGILGMKLDGACFMTPAAHYPSGKRVACLLQLQYMAAVKDATLLKPNSETLLGDWTENANWANPCMLRKQHTGGSNAANLPALIDIVSGND
jgi:hypothetical protein